MEFKDTGTEDFKKRMVLAVCYAGSDRSKYIREELDKRGYIASNGGVLKNHNYVTEDDLTNIGSLIFSSKYEQIEFNKNRKLKDAVDRNGINVFVMDITESEKERAIGSNSVNNLKIKISKQLDGLGFQDLQA